MKTIIRALFILCLLPFSAAASGPEVKLDHAPIHPTDKLSLQRGAHTFVNYCLSCHSSEYMRYNRLRDLGLTETQIMDNLVFTGQKVGELMTVAMKKKEAKQWFGVAPPDLSVIARSRGPDWLYTYLRTFYRDPKTVTGWNNAVFPNVDMPHVLWTLQGQRALELESRKEGGHETVEHKWSELTKGTQTSA